jgi:hypothetical protein
MFRTGAFIHLPDNAAFPAVALLSIKMVGYRERFIKCLQINSVTKASNPQTHSLKNVQNILIS